MAIIKKNQATPERPVIIVLYGTPGSGKTSVVTTANEPLLIDTDRGYDRAVQRIDTLTANRWEDITAETDSMKEYKTIIVDTAKAMLDDYLSAFAIQQNYKLASNALKRFGQMADDFKLFVNTLRSYGADIVFICHDKETQEGDIIKHSPDCTGQSKDLLLRIADQVGYISVSNGKRTITFEPQDNFVGKNVANLSQIHIPDSTSSEFPTFMATIIKAVKDSVQNRSEAQRLANEKLTEMRETLALATEPEEFDAHLEARMELPELLRKPFAKEVNDAALAKGFTYDKKAKHYVKSDKPDETNDKGNAA